MRYRFRATVYHLSSTVACVEGYAGMSRYVTEDIAEDESMFKAIVRDRYLSDVDAEVDFGPVTNKGRAIES